MTNTLYNFTSKTAELQLADVVKLFDGAFGTGVVKKIDENDVTVFRPYGVTADFTYTGGVICYTGIEEYKLSRTAKEEYFVYQRRSDLK